MDKWPNVGWPLHSQKSWSFSFLDPKCLQLHMIRHTHLTKKTSHSQTIWVLSLHHPIIFIIIIIIIPSSHHPIIIIILLLLIPFPERYCIRYPKNSPPISGEKSGWIFGPETEWPNFQVQFVPAKLRSTYNGAAPCRQGMVRKSQIGLLNKGASTELCFYCLVVWNMNFMIFMTFHILGMSSPQLTFRFFRGVL